MNSSRLLASHPAHEHTENGRGAAHRRSPWFLLIAGLVVFSPLPAAPAEKASPLGLSEVVTQQAGQLATVSSDDSAILLFATAVGPSLGLKDAAGAAAAKRLPSKLAKELGVVALSQSVSELMAALATWQLADSLSQNTTTVSTPPSLPAARQEWLKHRSRVESLPTLLGLVQGNPTHPSHVELRLAATRTAFESSQRAIAAWWEIYGWRERVRQAKGQSRLCGTWQWIIHNHQNHGEQKDVMVFPPPGQTPANIPIPTEMVVLGDGIYLRWEYNGRVQEDSLLFIDDGAKIEGSFVNNTGGWGPISGKRLAGCQP